MKTNNQPQKGYAVITGASSGIGREFVKRLDAQAQANGLSRSAYVNMVMVRHVTTEEARAQGFAKILKENEK